MVGEFDAHPVCGIDLTLEKAVPVQFQKEYNSRGGRSSTIPTGGWLNRKEAKIAWV